MNRVESSTVLPWIVWGLGCIFYFYECLLQVSPSVMSVELMQDFAVTSQTLGILSGIYFYSYAAMQLPGGLLMDYFGPRRLLTIATAVCAISTMGFGWTSNFYMACFARLMIGFGSAFAAVGTMKLAANWFNPSRFALLTGLMVTIGMIGAMGGEAPLAFLIDSLGWRNCMLVMGLIGIVLALLIFLVAKDTPLTITPKSSKTKSKQNEQGGFWVIIKNKPLWLVALYGGLMYMPTPVFCGLWGVPFLMEKMHIDKSIAATYVTMVFIGWAVAGPIWTHVSTLLGRRKLPLYFASLGAFITSSFFVFGSIQSGIIMQILLFLFGVFSAGFLPAFAIAKELCNVKYVATGLGFMNMMNMIGIAICQPFIGFILDKLWDGGMKEGVRQYTVTAYHAGLGILPLGIFVALLILPFIKETYCKNSV